MTTKFSNVSFMQSMKRIIYLKFSLVSFQLKNADSSHQNEVLTDILKYETEMLTHPDS